MTLESANPSTNGDLTYGYRPSLMAPPWVFTLSAHGLDWAAGNRSGRVRYRDVRRLRLSFKPASMQTERFLTEIWAEGAPKLQVVSASWKSMVEQEAQNGPYVAFVTELHARVARTASPVPVEYVQGTNPLVYWPGLALYAVTTLALIGVCVRALEEHTLGAAAFIGAFVGLFIWQGGKFFLRNRPGTYRPDALPPDLMPRERSRKT